MKTEEPENQVTLVTQTICLAKQCLDLIVDAFHAAVVDPVLPPCKNAALMAEKSPSPTPTRERSAPLSAWSCSSLTPALRPFHPRNTGVNAVTTRIIYARPTIGVVRGLLPRGEIIQRCPFSSG